MSWEKDNCLPKNSTIPLYAYEVITDGEDGPWLLWVVIGSTIVRVGISFTYDDRSEEEEIPKKKILKALVKAISSSLDDVSVEDSTRDNINEPSKNRDNANVPLLGDNDDPDYVRMEWVQKKKRKRYRKIGKKRGKKRG